MDTTKRVLLVHPARMIARRAAERIIAAGDEAVVATSIDDARRTTGPFARAIFAFDFADGSGIVLAAEMLLEGRVCEIEYFHPADDLAERGEHANGARASALRFDRQKEARRVA